MPSVWRVHIRPTGGTGGVDYQRSYDLCLRKNVIGIGWRVTDNYSHEPLTLRDYLAQVDPDDGSWNTAINRLRAMDQHDLV